MDAIIVRLIYIQIGFFFFCRYLSHKFHGKGSGKNKLEKRMKKWQEESVLKHMSSSDTPLQTLERQREKQKQIGSAYLVLSGNKSLESLDLKK